jgi:predicted nucleic acid-binding protein
MLVLDTNVFSVLMQPNTAPAVIDWINRQPITSIWTTTITIYEIRLGLSALPLGRKRAALEIAFERIRTEGIEGRVLDFNTAAALSAGEIDARIRSAGKPIDTRDVQIAGITADRQATLATRNVKHFANAGIPVIDPWDP